MGLLDGDTALVTGAASGIGRGIARALAQEGARLVVSDVAAEPGQALAREIDATFIPADLSDASAARPLFEAALAALGQISVFVHSASPRRSEDHTMMAVTDADWDAMLTVGLRSGFVLGQSVGADMKARGIKGRMLYITSRRCMLTRHETFRITVPPRPARPCW